MDSVEITLRVSRAAAEQLSDEQDRMRLGLLLSLAADGHLGAAALARGMSGLRETDAERRAGLREAIADLQAAARAAGITAEMVEDELAVWKREREEMRWGLWDGGTPAAC